MQSHNDNKIIDYNELVSLFYEHLAVFDGFKTSGQPTKQDERVSGEDENTITFWLQYGIQKTQKFTVVSPAALIQTKKLVTIASTA